MPQVWDAGFSESHQRLNKTAGVVALTWGPVGARVLPEQGTRKGWPGPGDRHLCVVPEPPRHRT